MLLPSGDDVDDWLVMHQAAGHALLPSVRINDLSLLKKCTRAKQWVLTLRPHWTLLSQSICCWPWELHQRFSRVQPFRTTTSICCEEGCAGVVLAVTSLFSQKKKDGWLQPLKLYATYSGVKQLSGKMRTMWNRSALLEVLCGYHSQPLCSELLSFIQFSSSESTARFIGIPSNLFLNVNISIHHNSRM